MVDANSDMDLYKVPSKEILRNRNEFYAMRREQNESVESWLKRLESRIICCEFPKFAEYFLIDKFVCKLRSNEMLSLQDIEILSFEELKKYFCKKIVNTVRTRASTNGNDTKVDGSEKLSVEAVKCEIVSIETVFTPILSTVAT